MSDPTLFELMPVRIASRIDLSSTGCWLFSGTRNGDGYCQTTFLHVPVYVHRYTYELANGPIPDGLVIDHLCRVRHCCNPEHMEAVTHRENILRGNGPTARNAAKTHCDKGHEFTPDNTRRRPDGSRECRHCRILILRRWRARHRRAA